jgi:hypothetical protein
LHLSSHGPLREVLIKGTLPTLSDLSCSSPNWRSYGDMGYDIGIPEDQICRQDSSSADTAEGGCRLQLIRKQYSSGTNDFTHTRYGWPTVTRLFLVQLQFGDPGLLTYLIPVRIRGRFLDCMTRWYPIGKPSARLSVLACARGYRRASLD